MAMTNLTNTLSQASNEANKEQDWVVEIRDTLINLDNRYYIPACIFRVPNLEADVKPEAYVPRVIALGPYHHFKPELYEFEHYKLQAVKRSFEQDFEIRKFDIFVEYLEAKVPDIGNFYRELPPYSRQTVACMMAIDGVYLLDLIGTVLDQKNQPDIYAILKDVLKLENQIPFVVFKLFHEINSTSTIDDFYTMLLKFCKEVSPFEFDWDMVSEPLHLLDLLYRRTTFREAAAPASTNVPCPSRSQYSIESNQVDPATWSKLLTKLSNLKSGTKMNSVFKVIPKLLSIIPLPSTSFFKEKKVLIPSVSELYRAGIKFCPTDGGTGTVKFDEKTKTFHLPFITMKRTTEVVMRNLVAYETLAKAKTKSLNFRRYTELMSAIVDTIEDVHILRNSKVLVVQPKDSVLRDSKVLVVQQKDSEVLENDKTTHKSKVSQWWDSTRRLGSRNGGVLSDAEIAEMFNGINRTMESKDEVIDLAIEKANKCYNETQKVKAYRLMKKYVYSSWKLLTVFASLLLLLLTGLQAVCDINSCPNIFHNTAKKI